MSGHEVFSGFYRQYYRAILTVAHRRLGSLTEAEDITAEVFHIAWRHYQQGGELSLSWAYQVLRNKIGEEYRRSRRARALSAKLETYTLPPVVHEHDVEALDSRRVLEALPEKTRELLKMAYWEDLSPNEIGQMLGISAATIRVRLLRARRQFKAEFNEAGTTAEVIGMERGDG